MVTNRFGPPARRASPGGPIAPLLAVGDLLISACESNGLKTDSASPTDEAEQPNFFPRRRASHGESAIESRRRPLHAVMPLNHHANG